MKCETVKIQAENKQGFIIINESDFDEKVHKKFEAKKQTQSKARK